MQCTAWKPHHTKAGLRHKFVWLKTKQKRHHSHGQKAVPEENLILFFWPVYRLSRRELNRSTRRRPSRKIPKRVFLAWMWSHSKGWLWWRRAPKASRWRWWGWEPPIQEQGWLWSSSRAGEHCPTRYTFLTCTGRNQGVWALTEL